MKHGLSLGIALPMLASHVAAMRVDHAPRPAVENQVKERFVPAPVGRQRLDGLLGQRLRVSLEQSLLRTPVDELLSCYRGQPAAQPWAGEYAGVFLRAASWAWAYSGQAQLKGLLEQVAQGLMAAQRPDGYLGIRPDGQRWTGFDVGTHASNLAGLLTYYEATGDARALQAARRIGDLLTAAFGRGEGQRDLTNSSSHGEFGAALLEPACLLYRFSGEKRSLTSQLLGFSGPNPGAGLFPKLVIAGTLPEAGKVSSDELLSGLVGLLELYRLSGEGHYLRTVLAAWREVASTRLDFTGATGSGSHFRPAHVLPGEESMRVGEACATLGWLQLGWHLLRLTGEPRYGDQLERTVYNHLLAAQDPRDGAISAYAPLVGKRRSAQGLSCCAVSHPMAMALISQMVWGSLDGALAILLYAPGEVTIPVIGNGGGLEVHLTSETQFPLDGAVRLTLRPPRPARFAVLLRVPAWCHRYTATVNGSGMSGQAGSFLRLERTWQPGDSISIDMEMSLAVVPGGASYPNHVAFQRGPQVLALEASVNPQLGFIHRAAPASLVNVALADASRSLPQGWSGAQAYSIPGLAIRRSEQSRQAVDRTDLVLVPFADAREYRVWLPRPEKLPVGIAPVTAFASEFWSRAGTVEGSICDERTDTYRTTYNGTPALEDWYAVELDRPELIGRVVYRHGKVQPNGGWFSTAGGKPVIQVRRSPGASWETVAALDSYPDTSASGTPHLRDGQPFEVKLKAPVRAVAVRILGRPGGTFSSCAELAAYRR